MKKHVSLSPKQKIILPLFLLSIVSTIYILTQATPGNNRVDQNNYPSLQSSPPDGIKIGQILQKPAQNPNQLSTYSYDFLPLTENDINIITKAFAFASPPETVNDAFAGPTYIWSNNEQTLLIKKNTRYLSFYNSEKVASKSNFDRQKIKERAEFITTNLNKISTLKFKTGDLNFYKLITDEKKEPTNPMSANIAQVEIIPEIDGYPLVGLSNKNIYPVIGFNKNNNVHSLETLLPPNSVFKKDTVNIIPFSDTIPNLNDKIKLLQVYYGDIFDYEKDPPSGKFDVYSSVLGYHFSVNDKVISPHYFLRSTGKSKSQKNNVDALLLVPAF